MKNDLNPDTEIENLGTKGVRLRPKGSPTVSGGGFQGPKGGSGNCILKGLAELLKGARCRPC